MTDKKEDLHADLAAANEAVKDLLREHAVSQGLDDGEKDSAQNNDEKNSVDVPGAPEDFEKIKEDRLKEASKNLKK